jgi:dynein heavy chain, axonemal
MLSHCVHEERKFRDMVCVQMVASMGPTGGGRNPVTPRLLRHFSTISFAELTDKSICRIFETIISAFANKYLQPEAASTASEIVSATTTIYNNIRTHLLPTPSKSHYTFNLRDISKVIQVCTSSAFL